MTQPALVRIDSIAKRNPVDLTPSGAHLTQTGDCVIIVLYSKELVLEPFAAFVSSPVFRCLSCPSRALLGMVHKLVDTFG